MKTIITHFLVATLFLISPQLSFSEEKPLEVAKLLVKDVEAKVEAFKADVGRYPTNEEGFSVLFQNSANLEGWNGPYLDQQSIIDPWGSKIRYISPHSMAPKGYGVYSVGKDTYDKAGYVDDVTSWSDVDESYYIEHKQALPVKSIAGFGVFLALVWGDYARRQRNKKKLAEKA